MSNHQGRLLGAVNLGPFVGVDLNMWPIVYIADMDVGKPIIHEV